MSTVTPPSGRDVAAGFGQPARAARHAADCRDGAATVDHVLVEACVSPPANLAGQLDESPGQARQANSATSTGSSGRRIACAYGGADHVSELCFSVIRPARSSGVLLFFNIRVARRNTSRVHRQF